MPKNAVTCDKTFELATGAELTIKVKAAQEDADKAELWQEVNRIIGVVEANVELAEEPETETESE